MCYSFLSNINTGIFAKVITINYKTNFKVSTSNANLLSIKYLINTKTNSTVPFLLRDDSLYGINTTRVIGLTGNVPSKHGSNKSQWQNDKQADAGYGNLVFNSVQ